MSRVPDTLRRRLRRAASRWRIARATCWRRGRCRVRRRTTGHAGRGCCAARRWSLDPSTPRAAASRDRGDHRVRSLRPAAVPAVVRDRDRQAPPRALPRRPLSRLRVLYRQPGIRPERLGDCTPRAATGASSPASTPTSASAGTGSSWTRSRRCSPTAPGGGCSTSAAAPDCSCEVAHERGFECYGVDLSADAIDYARTQPVGRERLLRRAAGRPRDRRRRLRRDHALVGARAPGRSPSRTCACCAACSPPAACCSS